MMRACVLSFVLAMSGAASAQVSDIPEPAHGSDPTAWFERYIEADGWTPLGVDEVAVALRSPDGIAQMEDGTLRVTVRHEYYQQRDFAGHPMRSMIQTRIVDCRRGENRIVAMTLFERSNMQGAQASRENASAEWSVPREGSLYLIALQRICAPNEGVTQN